jgi:hypothetical protein
MKVGQMKVGQMKVGQMKVGQMKVGQMKVGQMKVGQMKVGQKMWIRKEDLCDKVVSSSSEIVNLTKRISSGWILGEAKR